jgi:hypothetical protein
MIMALLSLWMLVSITFFGALAFVASRRMPSIQQMQLEEMESANVWGDEAMGAKEMRSATAVMAECSR